MMRSWTTTVEGPGGEEIEVEVEYEIEPVEFVPESRDEEPELPRVAVWAVKRVDDGAEVMLPWARERKLKQEIERLIDEGEIEI